MLPLSQYSVAVGPLPKSPSRSQHKPPVSGLSETWKSEGHLAYSSNVRAKGLGGDLRQKRSDFAPVLRIGALRAKGRVEAAGSQKRLARVKRLAGTVGGLLEHRRPCRLCHDGGNGCADGALRQLRERGWRGWGGARGLHVAARAKASLTSGAAVCRGDAACDKKCETLAALHAAWLAYRIRIANSIDRLGSIRRWHRMPRQVAPLWCKHL